MRVESCYYLVQMRRLILCFFLLQTVCLLAAERPTWSIFAGKLDPCPSGELSHCHSVRSPIDGKTIFLHLIPKDGNFDGRLTVRTEQGQEFALPMDDDWNFLGGIDVLWSPESTFVAITGGLNAYTESTRVFEMTPSGAKPLDVFHEATGDMLKSFPPCKASGMDREDCERQERHPFFSYAAIAWSNPDTLVVMAEIPCSSSYGSFMCQVVGYEIDVRTGHILRRMNARQFKVRWQHAMAWSFRIPESPESLTTPDQKQ